MEDEMVKRAVVRSKRSKKGRKHYAVYVDGELAKVHGRDRGAAFAHAKRVNGRRTTEKRAADRAELAESFDGDWTRAPEGARQNDLDHLVKAGVLERKVEQRWDRCGNGWNFGGAAVRRARYAVYRRAEG